MSLPLSRLQQITSFVATAMAASVRTTYPTGNWSTTYAPSEGGGGYGGSHIESGRYLKPDQVGTDEERAKWQALAHHKGPGHPSRRERQKRRDP